MDRFREPFRKQPEFPRNVSKAVPLPIPISRSRNLTDAPSFGTADRLEHRQRKASKNRRFKGSRMSLSVMALFALVLAQVPDQSLPPWGSNHHPTDLARRHVEPITNGQHAYVVRQGGAMDGANCRSPVGVGMMDGPAIEQTWESNRAVRLEMKPQDGQYTEETLGNAGN